MAEPYYFQWQNEFLCKTIYPMREQKLRDFLVYYMEVDIWAQYTGKDIAALQSEVQAYTKAQELAAITAYKSYSSLLNYFKTADVRGYYVKFRPTDEAEIARRGLTGPFKHIQFNVELVKDQAAAPSTEVERRRASA